MRSGLVVKLMSLARVDENRRLEVEVLVDLMVAVGMLIPDGAGYVRWHTASHAPRAEASTVEPPADSAADTTPAHSSGPALPGPRTPVGDVPQQGQDLAGLLSQPVLLADLARLSSEDLVTLHGHIHGLLATVAKLRSRPLA